MDNRKKNEKAAEKQQHKLKVAEQTEDTVSQLTQAPVDQQVEALTKRNREYVYRLRKALGEGGLSETRQEEEITKILPDILVAQKKGQPANQLFGPPVTKAHNIIHAPKPPKVVKQWMRMVDSILLFGAFMFAFATFILLSNNNPKSAQVSNLGILSLVVIAVLFGGGMTMYQDELAKPKSVRRPIWQLILLGFSLFAILFIALTFGALIPRVINPILPMIGNGIVAVGIYGIRYLFRRRYDIKGNVFSTQPSKNTKRDLKN